MTTRSLRADSVARGAIRTVALGLFFSMVPPVLGTTAFADDLNAQIGSDVLEEVVVTATRRQQDLQRVPISIAALTAADLAASGVKGISDLSALTPGVEFDQNAAYGSGTLTNIAIRGINSLFGSSTTGIYLDDTSLGTHVTPVSVFGNPYPVTFDLNRIEVLRGPQGTLFGAGSEGGTVRFIPTAPSVTDYSGLIHTEVAGTDGGDPSYETGAAFGGPIVADKLGFRFSVWDRLDGGYVNRVSPFPGNALVERNANWQDEFATRLAFLATPIDGLTITPSFYAQRSHKNDTGSFFDYLSTPSNGSYNNGRLLRQPTMDSLYVSALKVEADLGWSTLTSISSYTYRSANALTDFTNDTPLSFVTPQYNGAPVPSPPTIASLLPVSPDDAAPMYFTLRQRVYSQEIRLASPNSTDALTWVTGAYYSYANQAETLDLYSQFLANQFAPPYPASSAAFISSPTNINSQVAIFGQVDYKITPALVATAGLRIARLDTKQVSQEGGFDGLAGVFFDEAHSKAYTPKVSLSYQIDPDNMVYASVGKGYREGGVNPPVLPPPYCPPITLPYHPDSLWSYEVGAKDRFFDGRLQVDSSAYHIVWDNIQTLLPLACGFSDILNAGQSWTDGFDVALQAKLSSHWKLNFSAAYVNTRYRTAVDGLDANGNATIPFIQSGDTVGVPPQVPAPWSTTLAPEFDFTVADLPAYIRVDDIFHSHNSGPYVTTVNSFLKTDPSTNIVNIRSNIKWNHYDIGLFINNAANSRPRLGQSNDGSGNPIIVETTFRPLTFGLTADYRF